MFLQKPAGQFDGIVCTAIKIAKTLFKIIGDTRQKQAQISGTLPAGENPPPKKQNKTKKNNNKLTKKTQTKNPTPFCYA